MPSFKVLTFIHSWLPNDNEEGNHLYLLLVHERATQGQKDRGRERENRREMAPVAWLSTKLRGGPGGGLRQLFLQKCHSWERGSDPERPGDFFLLSPHFLPLPSRPHCRRLCGATILRRHHLQNCYLTDQLCMLHSSRLWFLKTSYHSSPPPPPFCSAPFKGPRALFSKPVRNLWAQVKCNAEL